MCSCKKKGMEDQFDMNHVNSFIHIENCSNDIFKTFLFALQSMQDSLFHPGDSNNLRLNENCLEVSLQPFDTNTWPKTLTIHFFESFYQCNDGITKHGTLSVLVPAPLFQLNTKYIISFSNFYSSWGPVDGTKTITISIVSNNNISFNDTTTFYIADTPGTMQWLSSRNISWVMGVDTKNNIYDDLFIYTGKGEYTALDGDHTADMVEFNANVISALQFTNWCYWIGSGKAEVMPEKLSARTITFLDSCTNRVKVTLDNVDEYVNF